MSAFPPNPVSPQIFFTEAVPALFDEIELDDAERTFELKLGVVLRGNTDRDSGGEWTLRFIGGALSISSVRDEDCDLTILQDVTDWRSALWEGHPALIADAVKIVAESGVEALRPPGAEPTRKEPHAALKGLSEIRGLIEAVIAAEGEGGTQGDWTIRFLVGPGPIPESPQATIRLGAEEADAIRRGELHPVEALITGQLRLEGDLGLIIQLQAVAMMAANSPSAKR